MRRSVVNGVVPALVVLLLAPGWNPGVSSQAADRFHVGELARVVLGGYAEDISYIGSGPYKGYVALKVGAELLAVPVQGGASKPVKLFDIVAPTYPFRVTGMVHVPELGRFVLNNHWEANYQWPEYLYLFDLRGGVERRPIRRGTPPSEPRHVEGLAYVPPGAVNWPPQWRGRLLMVNNPMTGASGAKVEVFAIRPDAFVLEQTVALPDEDAGWGDLVALPSGQLLLSTYGACSYSRLDPFLSTPTVVEEPISGCDPNVPGAPFPLGEGITLLPGGRLVASGEPAKLLTMASTAGGTWVPVATKTMQYGLGIQYPDGLAWDAKRKEFVVRYLTDVNAGGTNALANVSASLTSWTPGRVLFADPSVLNFRDRNYAGMTYRQDIDRVVVGRRGKYVDDITCPIDPPDPACPDSRTPALLEVPMAVSEPITPVELTATLEALSVGNSSLYNAGSWGNGPVSIAFVRGAGFATRLGGDRSRIYPLAEDGSPAGDPIPVAVTCDDPKMTFGFSYLAALAAPLAGARYLLSGSCLASEITGPDSYGAPLIVLVDGAGHEVYRFSASAVLRGINPSHVAVVTSGARRGVFAALDGESRLVVFGVTVR